MGKLQYISKLVTGGCREGSCVRMCGCSVETGTRSYKLLGCTLCIINLRSQSSLQTPNHTILYAFCIMHMYCIWNWGLSQVLTFIHVCTLYIQMAYSTVYESEDLAESSDSFTIYVHIVHEIFTVRCYTRVQYSYDTLSFCLRKWQHITRKCEQQHHAVSLQ